MTTKKRKLETDEIDKASDEGKKRKQKKTDKKTEKIKKKLCSRCEDFYNALNMSPTSKNELKLQCRHYKETPSPPHTPDGFWDLEIHTPESWK